MRLPWKFIGLAGLAGVAATGVVIARRRRSHNEYSPDELRDRLHRRLAEVEDPGEPTETVSDRPDRRRLALPGRRAWSTIRTRARARRPAARTGRSAR